MPAIKVRTYILRLCLLSLTLVVFSSPYAHSWETRTIGDFKNSDWRSIYKDIPLLEKDKVLLHGNEHAEISAMALEEIGAGKLLDTENLPLVVDLNASYFRRNLLYGKGQYSPENVPSDGLERRLLPPPVMFSGIPDFSYSIYDWINKNKLCPLPDSAPDRNLCHSFNGWLGAALNASHFGTQAKLNYQKLHKLALNLADYARLLRNKLAQTPGALKAYYDYLREAEWMALAYEGFAQHFLADRWSTGHMWDRWNAGDFQHLPIKSLQPNAVVGYLSGLIHGWQAALHAKLVAGRGVAHTLWSDPLSVPYPETRYQENFLFRAYNFWIKGESPKIELMGIDPAVYRHSQGPGYQGVGDDVLKDMWDGDFGGIEYGFTNKVPLVLPVQRKEMMACVEGGWADVIRALGKNQEGGYGIQKIPLKNNAPSLKNLGNKCFDMYVTNRSMMWAWPFSRPTYWSQLGRAILVAFSRDDVQQLLNRLAKGNPLTAAVARILKQRMANQLALGRRTMKLMVQISQRIWEQARRSPGSTDLARGGLGSLDFRSEKETSGPGAFLADGAIIEPGNSYPAASYLPPDDLVVLPDKDRGGRDKETIYGFFNRAMSPRWKNKITELLPELRGKKTKWEQSVCQYLGDFVYNGTDPSYHGIQAEQRTVDGKKDSQGVPSFFSALGVSLDNEKLPVYLPPGYVNKPYTRTPNNITYSSVSSWCAKVPILYLQNNPQERDKDIVAVVEERGERFRLKGKDLGGKTGRVWLESEDLKSPIHLEILSWNSSSIEVRFPEKVNLKPGDYRLYLRRADGVKSVGRFIVRYKKFAIAGTVRSSKGTPLSGAVITLEIGGKKYVSTSGDDGHYHIELPGDIKLPDWIRAVARRADYSPASKKFKREDYQNADFILTPVMSAKFMGCYRPVGDDSVALEINKDGEVSLFLDRARKRLPLSVAEVKDNSLRLRYYFTPESFAEFYQPYEKEEGPPGCNSVRLKPAAVICNELVQEGGVMKYHTEVHPINIKQSYLELSFKLETVDRGKWGKEYSLSHQGLGDYLLARDGNVFSVLSGVEELENSLKKIVLPSLKIELQGVDRTPKAALSWRDVLVNPRFVKYPPRIRHLSAVGADGNALKSPLSDGTAFYLRAEGASHCPGIREVLPVAVLLPGAKESVRIMLKETSPDSGIYQGPEKPLLAKLPLSLPAAHLLATADFEMFRRLGLAGLRDTLYNKIATKTTVSLEVKREKPVSTLVILWKSYRLEVRKSSTLKLPDISLIEHRLEEGKDYLRLIKMRYPVSLARGSVNKTILWSVGWRSGKRIEVEEASNPEDIARLKKWAELLRKQEFPLSELSLQMSKVLGENSRPLRNKWQPQKETKTAAVKKTAKQKVKPTSGKQTEKSFTYQGPPYMAHLKIKIAGGKFQEQQVVYAMPGKMRTEMSLPGMVFTGKTYKKTKDTIVSIVREDLGLVWQLNERSRSYREQVYRKPKITLTFEGKEKIKGKILNRYHFFQEESGGIKMEGTIWKDENGIPLRTLSKMKLPGGKTQVSEIVLENVRIGPLDEKLFELPPDYRPAPQGAYHMW